MSEGAKCMTVCGALPAAELGWCQIHEHIFVHDTPMAAKNPALRIDSYEKSLEELNAYRRAGGNSLCDAQPVAAGRDCEMLTRLSEQSGIAVIASTGYHLPGFYADESWTRGMEEEALFDLYCEELTLGMLPHTKDPAQRPAKRTAFRAGMVKAAIGADGAVGRLQTQLRAAARAAAYTGAPLMLHTERGAHAVEAIALAASCGLPPERMIVCHADRQAEDYAPHEAIAAAGAYLDYDTIGRFRYHSDEQELALIRHMLERGCGKQLLFALDTTASRLGAYGGAISLCYLLDVFHPMLRASGLDIAAANMANCRRVFSA